MKREIDWTVALFWTNWLLVVTAYTMFMRFVIMKQTQFSDFDVIVMLWAPVVMVHWLTVFVKQEAWWDQMKAELDEFRKELYTAHFPRTDAEKKACLERWQNQGPKES